jgi:hypothetical protein
VTLQLGSGTRTYGSGNLKNVFDNSTVSYACQAGGSYVPAPNDNRRIIVQFNDGTGVQTLPPSDLTAVPFAMHSYNSQRLGNNMATDFLKFTDFTGTCGAGVIRDSVRGCANRLQTTVTSGNTNDSGYGITSFNSSGYSLGVDSGASENANGSTYVSWTFKEAEKFFDIVTYTGNGANRTIAHNLGAVPGMIMVKRTDSTGAWFVWHNGIANTENLVLNTTAAKTTNATAWNSTTATSSLLSLGTHTDVNANGGTYVAYIFGHDSSTNGLIKCGSFTGTNSGGFSDVTTSLGWEPQYILFKNVTSSGDWRIYDTVRGLIADYNVYLDEELAANTTTAKSLTAQTYINANGFTYCSVYDFDKWIYVAIRRPNKPPTLGTQVFSVADQALSGAGTANSSSGFPVDFLISKQKAFAVTPYTTCRLTNNYLQTAATSAEGHTLMVLIECRGYMLLVGLMHKLFHTHLSEHQVFLIWFAIPEQV